MLAVTWSEGRVLSRSVRQGADCIVELRIWKPWQERWLWLILVAHSPANSLALHHPCIAIKRYIIRILTVTKKLKMNGCAIWTKIIAKIKKKSCKLCFDST